MFAKVAWIDVESFEEEMRQPICRRKTTLCGNLGERCCCLLQFMLCDFKSSVKYGLVYRLSVHLLKAQIKKPSGDAYMFYYIVDVYAFCGVGADVGKSFAHDVAGGRDGTGRVAFDHSEALDVCGDALRHLAPGHHAVENPRSETS